MIPEGHKRGFFTVRLRSWCYSVPTFATECLTLKFSGDFDYHAAVALTAVAEPQRGLEFMIALRTAFVAATLGAIACATAGAYPSTLNIKLYAQNRPGETGEATLVQIDGGVRIVVKMSGGQNGSQPIHIHMGTCANLDPVPKYALTNIAHGSSTTTIAGITLGDLLKGNYVIDFHESSADITRYVACAAIAMQE